MDGTPIKQRFGARSISLVVHRFFCLAITTAMVLLGVATISSVSAPSAGASPAAGSVYGWGNNGFGQLGDGTTTGPSSTTIASLPTGVQATAISTGGDWEYFASSEFIIPNQSLAIGSDGNLYSWGDNSFGELGDGSTTGPDLCGPNLCSTTPIPITLAPGITATAISAGAGFDLAIGSDGNVYSWGYNAHGQLGDGTDTGPELCSPPEVTSQVPCSTTPIAVTLAPGVRATAISAGNDFSLAIGSNGQVYSWGENHFGQLGNGTTTDSSTPAPISLAPDVTAVAISGSGAWGYSLAIGSDGNVYAWGDDDYGELGDGNGPDSSTPVKVSLASGVRATAISAGEGSDSLAIGSDGNLYAWGWVGGSIPSPVTTGSPHVTTLAPGVVPTAIASGGYGQPSLAIGSNGDVYSGFFGSSAAPTDIGLNGAIAVSTSGYFSSSLAIVPPPSTQISTSLSGEGQSGSTISVPPGTSVTDSATLSGTNAATATGTVAYSVYSDPDCTAAVNVGTPEPITTPGRPPSSSPVILTNPGSYYWRASYSGDKANGGSLSVCGSEVEVVSSPKEPTQLTTALSGRGQFRGGPCRLYGDEVTVFAGTAVTDSATLTGVNASDAGGTVTYTIYSLAPPGRSPFGLWQPVAFGGTVSVTNGVVPTSNPVTLPPGVYLWQASYSGDGLNDPSSSAFGSEIEIVVPIVRCGFGWSCGTNGVCWFGTRFSPC